MAPSPDPGTFEGFLDDLRVGIGASHEHLLPTFDTFAQEARFGRAWLEPSLAKLHAGSAVLEVGGGLMILSSELQREGFDVTALEPIGTGFDSFVELQALILERARARGHAPTVLPLPAETLSLEGAFDFAFSINVMEHVDDVPKSLRNVVTSLRPGAVYRFTCANYSFPYEPHFNIPTLFTKSLTERVLGRWIFSSRRIADQVGTWASLNWITVGQIRREVARMPGCRATFNRAILRDALARIVTDQWFASRRSSWVSGGIRFMVATGLHHLVVAVPAWIQPLLDCSIARGDPERADEPNLALG